MHTAGFMNNLKRPGGLLHSAAGLVSLVRVELQTVALSATALGTLRPVYLNRCGGCFLS